MMYSKQIQKHNKLEVLLLLLLILIDPPFRILLTLIVLVIIESKKMIKGVDCTIKRDLRGRVAIVTGGNTGIGKQTVIGLVQNGCEVVIAARDQNKTQKVIDQIHQLFPNSKVHAVYLNLSSKKQIQIFANVIFQKFNKVDYLVNNAGLMMIPERKQTQDGFQMQMGTNFLGHFYLTFKLWPLLKKSEDLRIVNVSSSAHYKVFKKVQLDFSNFNLNKYYQPMKAYCNSKLALILFTQQLAQKLSKFSQKARCVSLHPGFVQTQISRYIQKANTVISFTIKPVSKIFGKTPKQGAQTTLFILLSEYNLLENGKYYVNCQPSFKNPFASIPENQIKLWQISQELLNIKFDL